MASVGRVPVFAILSRDQAVRGEGFEPSTKGLKVPCSTAELAPRETGLYAKSRSGVAQRACQRMPFTSSARLTLRRFAKCDRAASEGATRPVSIFQTYCRWK